MIFSYSVVHYYECHIVIRYPDVGPKSLPIEQHKILIDISLTGLLI